MDSTTKPPTIPLATLREAIGRTLLEGQEDATLATIAECAQWAGTSVHAFMGKPYSDLTTAEATVGCRILAHVLLDVAKGLERAAVPA